MTPAGLFVGVFSTDQSFERRMLIRSTWASAQVLEGDKGKGLKGTAVRFVLGRPSAKMRESVRMEMESRFFYWTVSHSSFSYRSFSPFLFFVTAFGDIVLLDITENMNLGKTQAYFAWAAENAMVPDVLGGSEEKRPDYVVKADEDSFIVLGELEKRLRVLGGKKVYWGCQCGLLPFFLVLDFQC